MIIARIRQVTATAPAIMTEIGVFETLKASAITWLLMIFLQNSALFSIQSQIVPSGQMQNEPAVAISDP
jgi:hypothetical protein